MQVNPNIQYKEEDAGLTLDNQDTEPVKKVGINDTQDEADLITAEKEQREVTVKGSQVISSPRQFAQIRKNDRLIAASCMAAGVMSVVVIYFLLVFI